ncbi:unnamed protein product [Arctogadus glacialis]
MPILASLSWNRLRNDHFPGAFPAQQADNQPRSEEGDGARIIRPRCLVWGLACLHEGPPELEECVVVRLCLVSAANSQE